MAILPTQISRPIHSLLLAALVTGAGPSLVSAQSLPRPNVDPGEGPRIDYRDEAWEFWWFLNAEPLIEARRLELGGATATGRAPLTPAAATTVRAALERSLSDDSAEVRAAAAVALARLGEREILPRLVAALDDDVHEVRRAAVRAIGILGDPSAALLLEELVDDDDREGPLRQDAGVALGLLEADSPTGPNDTGNAPQAEPVTWIGHDGGVTAVSTDGGRVVSAGADGRARLHDPATGEAIVLFSGDASVAALAREPGHARVAAAVGVQVVLIPLGDERAGELTVDAGATALTFEPDRGDRIAVGEPDGGVSILRPTTGKQLSHSQGDGAAVRAIAWPAGGERVAVGAADGTVRVVFARTGRTLATLNVHAGSVTAILWADESGELLSCGADGRVARWSGRSADDALEWAGLDAPALSLARAPSGELVAIGAEDGTIRLHAPDGVERARVDGPGGPVTAISFLGDETLVAGTREGRLAPIPVPTSALRPATGPAPALDPESARSLALARLLAPQRFLALDSRAQVGVAIGAGATQDPALRESMSRLLARKIGLNKVVRGHLVASLAALGDDSSRDDLLEYLEDDDVHARRAAALGIGWLLADGDERDVLKALRKRQRLDSDVTIRNFLSISMGRIGGRYGVEPLLEALSEGRGGLLVHQGVVNAPRIRMGARSRISFAALGVGLSRDPAGLGPLLEMFSEEREISTRAALAVAIGLAGDARAAKPLRNALRSTKEPVFRSYVVLALGLLGDGTYRDRILDYLEREVDDELLLRSALALQLMADGAGERALVERLERERRPGARRAVLYALGRIGSPTVVPTLLAILNDPKEAAFVRRYAAVALGHVGSARFVGRWNAVTRIVSYPAEPNLLQDLLELP